VTQSPDYYEVLQISPNADPDTVHRVYRLLAQRFHPDNAESGNEARFRALVDAYHVLSDAERRAQYDVVYTNIRQQRWRLVSENSQVATDLDSEHVMRLSVLELLYTRRRTERDNPGLSLLDLEELTGIAREHLEFPIWYLTQKKFISRSDGASLTITVEGVEHVEANLRDSTQRRRLPATTGTAGGSVAFAGGGRPGPKRVV
jgi:curved DNA-binding protein CbpA